MYIPIAFGGKPWAKRWFSQNVGSLQVPWVSISSYRCSFPNCEIGSNLQPPILNAECHVAPIRVNWHLGPLQARPLLICSFQRFLWLWCSKTVKNLQKYENHQMPWQLNTLFSSHWVSAEQAPGDATKKKTGNFWVTLLMQKSKQVSNWFFSAHGSHEVHKSPENRFATLKPTCLWGKMLIMYDHVVLSSLGSLRKSARYLKQCASPRHDIFTGPTIKSKRELEQQLKRRNMQQWKRKDWHDARWRTGNKFKGLIDANFKSTSEKKEASWPERGWLAKAGQRRNKHLQIHTKVTLCTTAFLRPFFLVPALLPWLQAIFSLCECGQMRHFTIWQRGETVGTVETEFGHPKTTATQRLLKGWVSVESLRGSRSIRLLIEMALILTLNWQTVGLS